MSVINIKDLIVDKRIITTVKTTITKNKKPLLLVGKCSIGKTTLVLSIAKSLNYKILNIDPSSDFKNNKPNIFFKKQIILLDNLEEIKGQILSDLINHFIKDSRPLIMITSEVHKDLNNIKKRLKICATNYSFKQSEWYEYLVKKYDNIDKKRIKKLVKNLEYNKGKVVNQLNLNLLLDKEDISKTLTDFEIRENIFNKNFDRKGLYFQDNLLPLSIFDNYPKLKKNNINFCANTSSALVIIDEFETKLNRTQNYSLKPYIDIFTTEMATWDYNETLGFTGFPQYFGKMKKKDNSLLLETIITKN